MLLKVSDRVLPFLILSGIALMLGYYIVYFTATFRWSVSPVVVSQALPAIVVPNASQWHLFGAYDNSTALLPVTTLALQLEGVMVSPNQPRASYAIIQPPGHPAKVYRVGDTMPGGITLKRITNDQVVIEYQGRLQRLLLPVQQLVQ